MGKKDNLAFCDIANIYNNREKALRLYFSPKNPDYVSLFLGETETDITEMLKYQLAEINKDACFNLLAAIEAKFRLDYNVRGERRFRDALSSKCRELYRTLKSKVSLEDQIFDLWKDEFPTYKQSFSLLKGAYKYRHWLAHGRYWVLKAGQPDGYEFNDLYQVASIIDGLPFKV